MIFRNSAVESLRFIAGIVVLIVSAGQAFSQDRITIQQPGGSRFPVSGVVEDYNGREVIVQIRSGEPPRRYPRHEVVEVVTAYTSHHENGNQLLSRGNPTQAKVEFQTALKEEDRTWVRREILAQIIRCDLWKGDYRAATASFLAIVESDPETLHYGLAPLNWTNQASDSSTKLEARSWIADKSVAAQLIGASHLLFDREMNSQAETTLKRLARESNIKLLRLSQMQLWRVRSASGTATPGEVARWEAVIDELSGEMQRGGLYVLGQTLRQQQQPERAAAALLWLPLVYDSDRTLAARACFDAAELVESFGDTAQATNLYGELVFRFGDTPPAAKAEERWKKLRMAADPTERQENPPETSGDGKL